MFLTSHFHPKLDDYCTGVKFIQNWMMIAYFSEFMQYRNSFPKLDDYCTGVKFIQNWMMIAYFSEFMQYHNSFYFPAKKSVIKFFLQKYFCMIYMNDCSIRVVQSCIKCDRICENPTQSTFFKILFIKYL